MSAVSGTSHARFDALMHGRRPGAERRKENGGRGRYIDDNFHE